MEQVTQPLFNLRGSIDWNIILIPDEWVNCTGIHTIHSLSGSWMQKVHTHVSTKKSKYCKKCRRLKLAIEQREATGLMRNRAGRKVYLPRVQRAHPHRAPAAGCRVSMWFLHCQIIDQKSSISGSFSVLTTNSIADLCLCCYF